jgi:hypothetical protein
MAMRLCRKCGRHGPFTYWADASNKARGQNDNVVMRAFQCDVCRYMCISYLLAHVNKPNAIEGCWHRDENVTWLPR